MVSPAVSFDSAVFFRALLVIILKALDQKGDQYNAMNVEGKQTSNKKEQRMISKSHQNLAMCI